MSSESVVHPDFLLSSYQFDLPESQIAQSPPEKRGESRLLVLGRGSEGDGHFPFNALPELLPRNSLLVANNVRVIPARLKGFLPSGGKMELLLLTPLPLLKIEEEGGGFYSAAVEALARPARQFRPGRRLDFPGNIVFYPGKGGEFGKMSGRIVWQGNLADALNLVGEMPLPPYIRRPGSADDALRYQTVFSRTDKAGAVAAPTAGLHFTPELRRRLAALGHTWAELTLYVGYGTFSPVRAEDIRGHQMHAEWLDIPAETVNLVLQARQTGRALVAVGTTSARALEGAADSLKSDQGFFGSTDIFIYPGYRFKLVDRLITNFHLPGSSLLLLVSALAGRERILEAYRQAVERGYRFFSYGDAMFI
ncbi:MAG: tRNA preQ1(34) S-adenosylmethionine ribosyltransferase-isomerase QueA [Desulfovibrionaceae bacterium]|nr:tRNA preQ1(34) S-adenosylmethionine ribosyltransferase-isomerase QueA [Desulfovibrionaceae bacterium]